MEEIKVGEYVRLDRNQGINKIVEIDDKIYWLDEYISDKYGDAVCVLEEHELKDEIIKHSPNIIDLIEIGDYVNGFEVENVTDEHIEFYCNMRLTREQFNDWVKSIVTREAMKSVEYTIE